MVRVLSHIFEFWENPSVKAYLFWEADSNRAILGCWFIPGETLIMVSNASIQNKEWSNEMVKRRNSQRYSGTSRQEYESLLEKLKLTQQRKSLSAAHTASKVLLPYQDVTPTIKVFATSERSSISSTILPEFSRQVQRWSLTMPNFQHALRDSLHGRRLAKRISQETPSSEKVSRMSAASKDWELKLIDGLLVENQPHEDANSTEWQRFTMTGFPDKPFDEDRALTLSLPEDTPLPPSPKLLQVHRVAAKPCLKVVQAVQVNPEVLDEFEYSSDFDVSEDEFGSGVDSFGSHDVSLCISIEEPPRITVESEDWPLPSNGSIPTILSPITPLPHPLRCNPPERAITKSRSQASLRSVGSNRSNRKAFIMQHNDSSLSVHSLGTTTTKSVSDIDSVLDRGSHDKSRNRKFNFPVFGYLKRSNAVRSKPSPLMNVVENTNDL